jgi:hypothetical protein
VESGKKNRSRLWSGLSTAAISVLLCWCLVELGTWTILRSHKQSFLFFDVDQFVAEGDLSTGGDEKFDSELGWVWDRRTPNGERPSRFADRPLAAAAFGDSFVAGGEVGDDETWEEYLAAPSGHAIVNLGQSAYSSDQTLLLYRRLAPHVKAPVVIFGISSQNINTNVNVYRKFYYSKTGMVVTKPRFALRAGQLVLIPNPIAKEIDRAKLKDKRFILSLGDDDWWFNRGNLPVFAFPYSRIFLNANFWKQLKYGRFEHEINDVNPAPWEDLWLDDEAVKLTVAILQTTRETALANGSHPLMLHLPNRIEILGFLRGGDVPTSVVVLRKACQERGWDCLFPLYDMKAILPGSQSESWFQEGGHYSPATNRALAGWLLDKLRHDPASSMYFQ